VEYDWVEDRHKDTHATTLRSGGKGAIVYDQYNGVLGRVVATRHNGQIRVVVWANGVVEWLTENQICKHLEAWWVLRSMHTSQSGLMHDMSNIVDLKVSLLRKTTRWIAEHNLIKQGKAKESDYSAGFPFLS
jgi:hypothetical protein